MADFNSSLPVRTQAAGDVIVKLSDATTPSQQLAISAAGEASVVVTQALPAGTNTIGSVKLTDGTNTLAITAAGEAKVDITQPLPAGTNNIGSVNQGTSPWITSDLADGSVSGGAAGSKSLLGGGIYNSSLPTLTTGQQAALQLDSSGRLLVSATVPSTVTVSNFPTTVDTNYGTVGSSTLRSASQIGNATGAADFNAGATGAQTLRVVANQGAANATPWNENIAQIAGSAPGASNSLPVQISTGSAFVSSSNPLPVIIDPASAGTSVANYKDASAIISGSADSHDYAVTAGKTLYLQQVLSSASGKAKMVVQIETGVSTGVFNAIGAQFNSTATPNMKFDLSSPIQVAAGVRVRVIMSNNDLLAQDLYSTIMGFEV